MSIFVLVFYYLPMVVTVLAVRYVWWSQIKEDLGLRQEIRVKHVIALTIGTGLFAAMPMANFMIPVATLVYGITRVFENTTDHWWDKSFNRFWIGYSNLSTLVDQKALRC